MRQNHVCKGDWLLYYIHSEIILKVFFLFRFLEVLAGRSDPSLMSGTVLINGKDRPSNFKRSTAYVSQVCNQVLEILHRLLTNKTEMFVKPAITTPFLRRKCWFVSRTVSHLFSNYLFLFRDYSTDFWSLLFKHHLTYL